MVDEAQPAKEPTTKKSGHGGKRAGAGRRVAPRVPIEKGAGALAFLTACYESTDLPMPMRIVAAKAVVAATVARPGGERIGKKEQRQRDADEFMKSPGKYTPTAPPLHVVGRS